MSIYPNSIKPWSENEEERIRELGFTRSIHGVKRRRKIKRMKTKSREQK